MKPSGHRVVRGSIFVLCAVLQLSCVGWHPKASKAFYPFHTEDGVTLNLDAFIADHPLELGEPVRSDEVRRTADASYHVAQVRSHEQNHMHLRHDLTIVVQRGHGIVSLEGEFITVHPGSRVRIPRGKLHYFANRADDPAVLLAVFEPPFDGKDVLR